MNLTLEDTELTFSYMEKLKKISELGSQKGSFIKRELV